MPYLIFADHEQEFERLELYANSRGIVVGRAAECAVAVRDTLLSRHHCRFDSLGDRWIVIDLSSKNGTRVDGRSIERHVLRDGDVVRRGALESASARARSSLLHRARSARATHAR